MKFAVRQGDFLKWHDSFRGRRPDLLFLVPGENTRDRKSFTTRELPGFVYQRVDSKALIEFRQTIAPGFHLNEGMNALAKVIAVRKWVRDRQSDKSEDWRGVYTEDSEDPRVLLEEQRNGLKSACRRFSYILTGALLSIGMQVRLVCGFAYGPLPGS